MVAVVVRIYPYKSLKGLMFTIVSILGAMDIIFHIRLFVEQISTNVESPAMSAVTVPVRTHQVASRATVTLVTRAHSVPESAQVCLGTISCRIQSEIYC